MESLIDISNLNGKYLKILLELSPEVHGLAVEELGLRCLMRDHDTLRGMCHKLAREHGLLSWRKGSNGRLIWLMVGELIFLAGRLYWRRAALEHETAHPLKPAQQPPKNSPHQPTATARHPNKPRWYSFKKKTSPVKPAQITNQTEKTGLLLPPEQTSPVKPAQITNQTEKTGLLLQPEQTSPVKPAQITNQPPKTRPVGKSRKNRPEKPGAGDSLLKTISFNTLKRQRLSLKDLRERQNRTILQNTRILFSRPVRWREEFATCPLKDLLGWLAQGYQAYREGRSQKPWGLIYRALQGKLPTRKPDKAFRQKPWLDLPEEFLKACGLNEYAQDVQELGTLATPPQPSVEEKIRSAMMPEQEATSASNPQDSHTPAEEPENTPPAQEDDPEYPPEKEKWIPKNNPLDTSWVSLLGCLSSQMSTLGFNTWVANTYPLRMDAFTGQYWVMAPSEYGAAWLNDRVALTASRLLCGIMNKTITVRFVYEAQENQSNAILGEIIAT